MDRSLAPLIVGLILLLAVGGAIVWLVGSARTQSQIVFRAFEVQRLTLRAYRGVQAAESAQRGFLLTGDDRYLEPYHAAAKNLPDILGLLLDRTSPEPAEHADALGLKDLIGQKFEGLSRSVTLTQAGNQSQALALLKTDAGRELMVQIRTDVDRMLERSARTLNEEYEEGQDLNRALLFATLAALFGVLAVGTLVIRLNRRAMQSMRDSENATATLNEGLEAAVLERTTELTESNEEIQRFAYIVSHDLRAPLVNVMGFTSELEALKADMMVAGARPDGDPSRVKLDEEFNEAIGYIKSAINKMEGLIAAILRLSREGRRTFRPERVDTTALMKDLAAAQKHQADAAGASVVVDPDLPVLVADRVALEQIFGNLIDNGVKYLDRSRPGRVEITGETIGERARITVRDNGRGIAESDHRRVFELFRRAGQQDRPGEGIGLAHVQTMVRSLGGRITLASELGKGTSFTVILPLAPKTLPERTSVA